MEQGGGGDGQGWLRSWWEGPGVVVGDGVGGGVVAAVGDNGGDFCSDVGQDCVVSDSGGVERCRISQWCSRDNADSTFTKVTCAPD